MGTLCRAIQSLSINEIADSVQYTLEAEMIKFVTIAVLVCSGLLLPGCAAPQSEQTSLFPDWNPNVDQPIQQLEETLAKLDQQQRKNYTISNLAFLYDAQLYILFHDFIVSLPESARASEIAEQRNWLAQRKAQIHAAYSGREGGTLASYMAGQASIDATKERIAEIEKKMDGVSKKSMQVTPKGAPDG